MSINNIATMGTPIIINQSFPVPSYPIRDIITQSRYSPQQEEHITISVITIFYAVPFLK